MVGSLKRHLAENGLEGRPAERFVVAADATYIDWSRRHGNELEPIANVRIGTAKPDLVCLLASGSTPFIAGFEVKARPEVGGVAQALAYRSGVHLSYVAFPEASGVDSVCRLAENSGIGVFVRKQHRWTQVLAPPRPTPEPQALADVELVLRGAAVARRLQLNHPLNYLVVPLVALEHEAADLAGSLASAFPDLRSANVIRMAIDGARSLGLVDARGVPTPEGRATADIMLAGGFVLSHRLDKRLRLVDASPLLGAVARSVLVRQPAVQLIVQVLRDAHEPLLVSDLARAALRFRPDLAAAVFFSDASATLRSTFQKGDFNPSAVFKLKQNLWHAGVLSTKALPSAAKGSQVFKHEHDMWQLDRRVIGPRAAGEVSPLPR